ncbi:MAG: hypothetical protein SPL47_02790 [Bacteroidales bacterium]|nr:hypothetical protein [Bacteroidales bacterium]
MKSGLAYKVVSDVMFMAQTKGMVMRIQIQIWVTLIANLLLTIMQRSLRRRWSFSNLATTVRITLMYYVDFLSFFENPEKTGRGCCWKPQSRLRSWSWSFREGALNCHSKSPTLVHKGLRPRKIYFLFLADSNN